MGRVAIIESINSVSLKTYGVGELIIGKIPHFDFFYKYQIKVPCVLINGIYIWQFQGIIMSVEEHNMLMLKTPIVQEVYPKHLVGPSEPNVFYGYKTKENKIFIRNFTNQENVDSLRAMVFVKTFVEPFEANSLYEAKLKLSKMIKC